MAEPLTESTALIVDPEQRVGVDADAIRHCAIGDDGMSALVVGSELKSVDLRTGETFPIPAIGRVLGVISGLENREVLMWTARDLFSWAYGSRSTIQLLTGDSDHHLDAVAPLAENELAFARREGQRSYFCRFPLDSRSFRSEAREDTTLWMMAIGQRSFACGQSSGLVEVWTLSESGGSATHVVLRGHTGPVVRGAVVHGRAGQLLATASADLSLRVWKIVWEWVAANTPVPRSTSVVVLDGHRDEITDLALSPDGSRVASASRDRTIRLWSIADGRLIKTLTDHQDWVTKLAINPDGTRMASCSDDGTIKLWDLETLECIATAYGVSRFLCLAMSSDLVCAGDASGNFWMLQYGSAAPATQAPQPAQSASPVARRYFVIGRVQGVGYRVFAQNTARGLEVRGFVRNLPDGRVEVYAIGSEQQHGDLKKALAKGPPASRIERVDEEPAALSEQTGFTVAR